MGTQWPRPEYGIRITMGTAHTSLCVAVFASKQEATLGSHLRNLTGKFIFLNDVFHAFPMFCRTHSGQPQLM